MGWSGRIPWRDGGREQGGREGGLRWAMHSQQEVPGVAPV